MSPSDRYTDQWTMPSLVQIIACRLFWAMPLSYPTLLFCCYSGHCSLHRDIYLEDYRDGDVIPLLTHWSYVLIAWSHQRKEENIPLDFVSMTFRNYRLHRHGHRCVRPQDKALMTAGMGCLNNWWSIRRRTNNVVGLLGIVYHMTDH